MEPQEDSVVFCKWLILKTPVIMSTRRLQENNINKKIAVKTIQFVMQNNEKVISSDSDLCDEFN